MKNSGYHINEIPKGEIGKFSKIYEECLELKDAIEQNSKVMALVELSDLYGAIEEYCKENNIEIEEIKRFSDITKRAFKNGHRK